MKQIVKVIFLLVLTFAELAINARCVAADEPAVNFEQVNFVFVVGPLYLEHINFGKMIHDHLLITKPLILVY